ncbi:MAG: nucleotidyltransferase domain-containing protein [Actinobacteria bacterium]|nr:nucleotidyltransferase domain-containing protein [Actinomycetota bacterium]
MRIKRPLDDLFSNRNNVRVLRQMILYPSSVMTGRGIARELGMSHATCIRSLNTQVNTGILTRRRVGNSATYEIARDSVLYTDILEPAFRAEARLLKQLADTVLCGIKGKVLAAYLFGSVARGDDTLSSDVDVLVLIKESGDKAAVEKALAQNKEDAYRLYRLGVSAIVYDKDEYDRMKAEKNPLIEEVMREGILLAGKEVR